MNFDDIKKVLEPNASIDVSVAYKAFRKESGSKDIDLFLVFLRDRGYLSDDAFLDLHTTCFTVELTGIHPEGEMSGSSLEGNRHRPPIEAAEADSIALLLVPREDAKSEAQAPVNPPGGERYTLLGMVGEGGMGEVHVAKDRELRRKVALKRLKAQAASQKDIVVRFLNEAQITAQLDHPNIVPVYSLETRPDGGIGYAMKLVQGKTLKELIEEAQSLCAKGAPLGEACSLPTMLEHFLKVCDAIAFAHSKGVIHRDIKPANIMLGRYNEVYVMDWGIARLLKGAGTAGDADAAAGAGLASQHMGELDTGDGSGRVGEMTEAGFLLGTPRYMSPEQAEGKNSELDGKSDQYALGLMLFELVSLRKAIPGDSPLNICKSAIAGTKVPLVPLSSKLKIPDEIAAMIHKATARKPEDRYATVHDFAEDIRRYVRGEAISALPDSLLQKMMRSMMRHRQATLLLVLAVVFGMTLVSVSAVLYQRSAAAVASKVRSEKVSRLLLAATRQSQELNAELLALEVMVENTASTAAQSIARGAASEEPVYFSDDFAAAGRKPPGTLMSSVYGGEVSFDWPAWTVAAGVSKDGVLPALRRLAPMRADLKRTYLRTRKVARTDDVPSEEPSRLAATEGPVRWVHLGLADGTGAIYPGTANVPEGYDPRTRPWYTLAAGKRGVRWGNPYIDKLRGDSVLACSTSLVDASDAFLGVAGMAVPFHYIIRSLMTMEAAHDVEEAFLLDENARIVVRSKGSDALQGSGAPLDVMPLEAFPIPQVAEEIQAKRSGHMEIERPEGAALVVYNRVSVLGWYYVVVAPMNGLLDP